MPALPLGDSGPYVAAAYLVFLALILVYVAIMAGKLARLHREIGELVELTDRGRAAREATAASGEDEPANPAAGHAAPSEAGLR
jgi:CcmD family protein